MKKERDPTRRDFLLDLARRSAYAAPLLATFRVAPALAAVQGMSSLHKHPAPPADPTLDRSKRELPSDKYRPRERPGSEEPPR